MYHDASPMQRSPETNRFLAPAQCANVRGSSGIIWILIATARLHRMAGITRRLPFWRVSALIPSKMDQAALAIITVISPSMEETGLSFLFLRRWGWTHPRFPAMDSRRPTKNIEQYVCRLSITFCGLFYGLSE